MSIPVSLLLGILQGLTEFLPVSSSGHLVLARVLLDYRGTGATFEIAVHVGTVLSIVTVFFRDVRELLLATPRLARACVRPALLREDRATMLLALLLLSAVPAGLAGLLFKDRLEELFGSPKTAGICLIVTGLMLLGTAFLAPRKGRVGLLSSVAMGLAQMVAILPGISRSGSAIAAGLATGSGREEVARFAFLMAILPILGAGILELRHVAGDGLSATSLAVGVIASYASGVLALRLLLGFVSRGRLSLFAPYCFLVGILGLLI